MFDILVLQFVASIAISSLNRTKFSWFDVLLWKDSVPGRLHRGKKK